MKTFYIKPSALSDLDLVSTIHSFLCIIFNKKKDFKPIPYYLTQQEIDFVNHAWGAWLRSKSVKLTAKQRAWMERCYTRITEYRYPKHKIMVD